MIVLDKLFKPLAADSGTANPAQWLVDWFRGGAESESGATVNPETAMTSGPFYQAVSILSGDVAQMPFRVMKRKPDGDTEHDLLHEGGRLMDAMPNDEMTPNVFIELMQSWAFLFGDAVAFIERRGSVPTALIPLLPDRTHIERGPDGQKWYVTRVESNNTEHRFRPEQVLHIFYDSPNGATGRSKVSLARNTIALDLALRKHGNYTFKNGARPGGTIERAVEAGPWSDVARKNFKREWNEMHQGLDNTAKIAVLQEGMKFNPISTNNVDAEWIAAQRMTPEQIARHFKIPPYKLGAMQDSSVRANLEQQNRDYLSGVLGQMLIRWEQECNKKLLTNVQNRQRTHFFKFNPAAILKADIKTRYETYAIARAAGILSPNEIRRLEDMPRRDDEDGDSYDNPNTSSPTGGTDPSSPDNNNAVVASVGGDAHRELIADRVRQMFKVERQKVARAAKHGGNFLAWVDEFYDDYGDLIEVYLGPSVKAAEAAAVGVTVGRVLEVTSAHAEASRRQLVELAGVATADTLYQLVEDQKQPSVDELVDAIFSREVSHAAA